VPVIEDLDVPVTGAQAICQTFKLFLDKNGKVDEAALAKFYFHASRGHFPFLGRFGSIYETTMRRYLRWSNGDLPKA
jgi:hypothetical protein